MKRPHNIGKPHQNKKRPVKLNGVHLAPAIPRDFDFRTATADELVKYGLPGLAASNEKLRCTIERYLPTNSRRIIPKLRVSKGKTHVLRRKHNAPVNATNVNTAWSGGVILNADRVPQPITGSKLDGYSTPFNSQQHVNFIGTDAHLYELCYANARWTFRDLTREANALLALPLANSPLDGYATAFNEQQHVNYIGRDYHVHELWHDDAWHHSDLTSLTGAPDAIPGSSLVGFATSFNQHQHVVYMGTDNHIHELWYDDAWHHNDLSVAGATQVLPRAGTPLDGYATEFNRQQHVNYIGVDNHVHELWYDTGWHAEDLTRAAKAPNAAGGSALAGYATEFNHQQHVDFIGTDGHVHELWYDGGWRHNDLSVAAGATGFVPRPGSPLDGFAALFNEQQHVNYLGTDNHVHELWFSGRWMHNDITVQGGSPPNALAGSPIAGYATEFNHQQHVLYFGADQNLYEIWYQTQWLSNNLSQSAVIARPEVPWVLAMGFWTIPTVSEPDEPPGKDGDWESSSWVGIDGYFTNDVLQAGIEQVVDDDGDTKYVAWYEWYAPEQGDSPDYIYQTNIDNFIVAPGEQVFCSVQYTNNLTQGTILLVNQSTGRYFSIALDPPPGAAFAGNSIEWIMEAPDSGEPDTSLPEFTPVIFNPAFGFDINGKNGNPQNGFTVDIARNGMVLTLAAIGNDSVRIDYLSWHAVDLTRTTAAPTVAGARALDGYATAFNEQQHINFIAADNHVHELWYDRNWHYNDLTRAAGAALFLPRADSPLDGYSTEFNQQPHVNYVGADSHVHELWYDNGWHHNDLTALAGGPNAAPGTALAGYATESNRQQHVVYIGTDNRLHELWYDSGWHHNDLTLASGAPNPIVLDSLAGYATEFNQQQHIIFIGPGRQIYELWYDGTWHNNDLTLASGAVHLPAARGSKLAGYATNFNEQQHVIFVGIDNHLHEFWYDHGWHHNDLSVAGAATTSLPQTSSSLDGYATSFNEQQHVNYIGTDNRVHELWFSTRWRHNDLTAMAGDPTNPLPTTPLAGYATEFTNQQHVVYIGTDNGVHELYY
jgi:hypothetical protein